MSPRAGQGFTEGLRRGDMGADLPKQLAGNRLRKSRSGKFPARGDIVGTVPHKGRGHGFARRDNCSPRNNGPAPGTFTKVGKNVPARFGVVFATETFLLQAVTGIRPTGRGDTRGDIVGTSPLWGKGHARGHATQTFVKMSPRHDKPLRQITLIEAGNKRSATGARHTKAAKPGRFVR